MKQRLLSTAILIGAILFALLSSNQFPNSAVAYADVTAGHHGPVVGELGDVYLPIIVNHDEDSNCLAIQEAIDGLPTTGGEIILSRGEFTCDTAIVIARDRVSIRGQGPSTILRLANNANSPVIVLGDTNTPPSNLHFGIQIANLAIDGNQVNQQEECWGGACDTGGLTYIRNNGITLRHVRDVRVENVSVTAARSGGLVSEKECERLTVSNFTSSENYFDGIAGYQTENSLFTDLYLHHNEFAGISLDIEFNNNIFNGAVLSDNGRQGIFMRDARDNIFTAIQIRNSGEQGIFLAQVDTDSSKPAAGNTFSNMVISDSAQDGMRVNDSSCENNLVVGAQFVDNQGACISEADPGLVTQVGIICR